MSSLAMASQSLRPSTTFNTYGAPSTTSRSKVAADFESAGFIGSRDVARSSRADRPPTTSSVASAEQKHQRPLLERPAAHLPDDVGRGAAVVRPVGEVRAVVGVTGEGDDELACAGVDRDLVEVGEVAVAAGHAEQAGGADVAVVDRLARHRRLCEVLGS